jgi:hypothetical protein
MTDAGRRLREGPDDLNLTLTHHRCSCLLGSPIPTRSHAVYHFHMTCSLHILLEIEGIEGPPVVRSESAKLTTWTSCYELPVHEVRRMFADDQLASWSYLTDEIIYNCLHQCTGAAHYAQCGGENWTGQPPVPTHTPARSRVTTIRSACRRINGTRKYTCQQYFGQGLMLPMRSNFDSWR